MPSLSEYVRKRYRVLFECWLPGVEEVLLNSCICKRCGFISNVPRPTEVDVDAKYRFLADLGQDYGTSESEATTRQRSRELYASLRSKLSPRGAVLDYGGGDGRLMAAFAEAKHRCLLMDYNASPCNFVEKIGNTIADFPKDLRVDAVICSHVIEHVVDPVRVMQSLAGHLLESGVMYVEVPMEIWGRAPLHEEPVTHINFFAPSTLKLSLQAAGLGVQTCKLTGAIHPTGRRRLAIKAIGFLEKQREQKVTGASEVRKYLEPGLMQKIQRRWALGFK
jgi:SAM-dependent methyltransferase